MESAYILGTDAIELHRLAFQHQVWSEAMYALWHRAGFTANQAVLDLGCGPGYDAIELAHTVGPTGKVVAVDKSEGFIEFLKSFAKQQLVENIETQVCDFHDMHLQPASLEGAYARWSLCWVGDVEPVVKKIADALKPGGVLAVQEYFNWGTHSAWPPCDSHARIIQACLASWERSEGDINIARKLAGMCTRSGLRVTHIAPLSRLGRPGSMAWQWVTTFLHSYVPRLITMGLLDENDYAAWQEDWAVLENDPAAFVYCPQMIELACRK